MKFVKFREQKVPDKIFRNGSKYDFYKPRNQLAFV